jgi:hypothetical protein
MPIYPVPQPVFTEFIRIPAAGPDPCNTLAFLRCSGGAVATPPTPGRGGLRAGFRFETRFRIDGFQQSKYNWYLANTLVSATAHLRDIRASTDMTFQLSVESVTPHLSPDGVIGFDCQLVGEGEVNEEVHVGYGVSAYVLLYEPRVELPRPGVFSQRLNRPDQLAPLTRMSQSGPGWTTVRRATMVAPAPKPCD